MPQKTKTYETKYWLWVTRPEHWLDKNGNDSSFLNPKKKNYKGEEWSCSKETKKGDFVFLWRSKSELRNYLESMGIRSGSDIGYLIRAESRADGPRKKEKYPYWCNYKPLYKFENPVTIEDFRKNLILQNSVAYKVNFIRNSFPLSKEEWDIINQIASPKNPGYKTFLENLLRSKLEKVSFEGQQDQKGGISSIQQQEAEKPKERFVRKYGSRGEGMEHKKLKNWVAENPGSIGILDINGPPREEYGFISGDTADILFKHENNKFTVVEIETNNPEPGFYQALKYKILKCAEVGIDINSSDVKAILVAWSIPETTQKLCNRYNVEFREIKRNEYN